MDFRYPIEKHAGVNALDGILKLNHLLFNELFKWKKIHIGWGQYKIIICRLEMLLENKMLLSTRVNASKMKRH
jgi:hypothetical protein